jgi:hypothetical protein
LSPVKVRRSNAVPPSKFVIFRDDFEGDDGGVNQLFTPVFKIDRNAAIDRRLDLTNPPIGSIRVADKCTGNKLI